METGKRNVWILIVVIVLIACFCVALAAVGAASWFLTQPASRQAMPALGAKVMDQSFGVGASPQLKIENFAGSVTVLPGRDGEIRVVASKHTPRAADLDRIQLEVSQRDGGLLVKTTKPFDLSNAWVDLEITAPSDTVLDLQTGSGAVDVSGLGGGVKVDTGSGSVVGHDLSGDLDLHTGSGSVNLRNLSGSLQVDSGSGRLVIEGMNGAIIAHTGSGSVDLKDAAGPVQADSGSGSIDYHGSPQGDCRFETGTGSITLRLPDGLNARVDLHTGSGSIDSEFAIVGEVTREDVNGVIGSGGETTIQARTGSGSIKLGRQ